MSAAGVFITGASFFSRSPLRVSLIIAVVHHVSETPLPQGFRSAQVFTFASALSRIFMSQCLLFLAFSFH